MQRRIKTDKTRLSRRNRLTLAATGVGLLVLLLAAAWLEPSPNGHGTHQQLGLPSCTFLTVVRSTMPNLRHDHRLGLSDERTMAKTPVGQTSAARCWGILAVAAVPWLLGSAFRGAWLRRGRYATRRLHVIASAVLLVTFNRLGLSTVGLIFYYCWSDNLLLLA